MVAGVIGGVPGAALSYLVPFLVKAFGGDGGDLTSVAANMAADPELVAKITGIAGDHGAALAALGNDASRLIGVKLNLELTFAEPK